MKELRGKTAVVTGGGSGIGLGLVRAFAAEGMQVAVADVDIAAAEAARDEVLAAGGRAIAAHCDVASAEEVEALAAAAYAEFGAVHLLCNNAGVVRNVHWAEMPPADWQWVLGVNLQGVVNSILAFLPRMLAQGGEGHILNTASMAGIVPVDAKIGSYVATKYAVVGISEVLRQELAGTGIGVSVLLPGQVATRLGEAGRNRPPSLGGPFVPAPRDPVPGEVIDPARVATLALRAIRDNELYVFTHNRRDEVEKRFAAILRGFDYLGEARGERHEA